MSLSLSLSLLFWSLGNQGLVDKNRSPPPQLSSIPVILFIISLAAAAAAASVYLARLVSLCTLASCLPSNIHLASASDTTTDKTIRARHLARFGLPFSHAWAAE
jgi:hypothetical protein